MMALGKGVREGVIYDQPVQSIDLVPSLGAMMGFSPDSLTRKAHQRATVIVMQPSNLNPGAFASYPPEARKLIVAHLEVLRQLPLSFVPNLLGKHRLRLQVSGRAICNRKGTQTLTFALQRRAPRLVRGFAQITLAPALERLDWVNQPVHFGEQESAHLWTTHQQDAFREAATAYGERLVRLTAERPACDKAWHRGNRARRRVPTMRPVPQPSLAWNLLQQVEAGHGLQFLLGE